MSFNCPTKEEEDQILKEIGYSRSQLEKDIPSLRLWLQEQTHLPACRLKENDIFLTNFLVGCKGSIETAKRKMDHYYSLRGKGEAFSKRDTFDYFDSTSKYLALMELPKATSDTNVISLLTLFDANLDLYNAVDTMRYLSLAFEYRLRIVPISGPHISILDASNYTMSHFLKVPPIALRTFLSFIQDGYPMRVKKILVTNVPSVLATAINSVVMPFLSKKLKGRLLLTSEPLEKVFDHVELLPKDFPGGKAASVKELTDALVKAVKTSPLVKDLLPQLQEEVDESKRPQLENGINDPYFGLHGSIKTLVLD